MQKTIGQTIVAAATAAARSGVAVVRISGDCAFEIIKKLTKKADFLPRMAEFCVVDTGEIRDEALVIFFKSPRSYTGEDVAEIHCHGNPLIVLEIIEFCLKNGARLASAGEFTRRAFLNGKSDLSSAEAVADIISAETKLQLSAAESIREGSLKNTIAGFESEIYDIIAELNAAIDYPEEDIELTVGEDARQKAANLAIELQKLADTFRQGRLIKDGVRIAIYGAPNVGKSSLLNAILGKNRAIVSEIAGTTRDTIEDRFEYKGIIFIIVDTAGIRETAEYIEKLGIQRANDAIYECDVILSISDNKNEWLPPIANKPTIYIKNKIDLADCNKNNCAGENSKKCVKSAQNYPNTTKNILNVSALTGENVDKIKAEIYDRVVDKVPSGLVLTNLRHYQAVTNAVKFLRDASALDGSVSPEIISFELSDAAKELAQISGLIGCDEVVDRIFAKFCVGK